MKKMHATIEVEFEADREDVTENVLDVAFRRGVGELAIAIEHGVRGAGPTNIKKGSAKTKVLKQNVSYVSER
jgi:hypothetical protein